MVILRFGLLWERNLAAERPVKPPPMIKKSVSWSADSGVMAGDSRDLCQKDGVALRVHEKSMLKEKAKKPQDHDFTLTFLFFLLSSFFHSMYDHEARLGYVLEHRGRGSHLVCFESSKILEQDVQDLHGLGWFSNPECRRGPPRGQVFRGEKEGRGEGGRKKKLESALN